MSAFFFFLMWLVTANSRGEEQLSDDDLSDDVDTEGSGAGSVRCYRCAVVTVRGCDVTEMSAHRDKFTVNCEHHCLNLTAGIHASYDCADNSGGSNYCIENEGTRICVCNTDYCNGPPPVSSSDTDIDFTLPSENFWTGTVDHGHKSAHEKILLKTGNKPEGLHESRERPKATTKPNSCSSVTQTFSVLTFALTVCLFLS